MSWKVLVTARGFGVVGESPRALLESAGCEVVIPPDYGPLAPEVLARDIDGIDAVLCSPDPYTEALFSRPEGRNLKIISRWGVGYDSIDIPAATAAGIVVAYTPGLLDEAVADYAFALLLNLARHTGEVDNQMKAGKWSVVWGTDIFGKTIGLVGCGRIGQAVVRRAQGFGMRVLVYDVVENPAVKELGVRYVTLPELLAESDFVSLHAALTPENTGMMNEAAFRQMKSDALFVNTARGAHVDEAALAKALSEGWIRGAAVDAFVEEPLPVGHPFLTAPNLILSPHQASSTYETGERVALQAAQSIIDLMQGKAPEMVVNREVFESPSLRATLRV